MIDINADILPVSLQNYQGSTIFKNILYNYLRQSIEEWTK